MMTQDYPHLFADNPEWHGRAIALAAKVVDLTSFLDRAAQLPAGALVAGPARTVTYHDACQSANCLGLRPEARRLIQEVMGLPLVEMAESSRCCGFGGSFSFDYPEVSRRILSRKLGHVAATGADTVVADNPGCLLQLRGGLDATGSSIDALHLVELMAERLPHRA
jgi:Fe-S oxidoreductase